jgi:ferredoxin
MPDVVFTSEEGEPLSASAPLGGSLGDLCDDVGAPVAFSCRSATCGTCLVVVLEGGDLLSPPERDEAEILALFAEPSSPFAQRLACQAKMRPGPGRLVLRSVNYGEP